MYRDHRAWRAGGADHGGHGRGGHGAETPGGRCSDRTKARGPKGRGRDPVTVENEQLRKENARLRQRLEQAETILDIQKKASELLGIPLNPPLNADDE